MWTQKTFKLAPKKRGFHLITDELLSDLQELKQFKIGLLHIFLQHTSASLAINENADPTVREDLESHFTRTISEDLALYKHNYEGADDMPAHIKAVNIGTQLTIPITDGRLNLGTWQGIYLCEHRNHARERTVVMTIQGEGF